MDTSERISSTFQYVIEGVIRQPRTWILLSILGTGEGLITFGRRSLLHKYFPELKLGVPISLPPPFSQYAIHIVIFLIILGILLIIVQTGYITRIYRGISPAPPVREVKTLFRDGFLFSVIGLGYSIIPVLIVVWTVVIPLMPIINELHQSSSPSQSMVTSPELLHTVGIAIGGLFLSGLLFIVFTIIGLIGLIRFSRTGRVRSAFEISAILTKIGEIGWIRYLLSLLLLVFLILLFSIATTMITVVLAIIGFIVGTVIHGTNEIMTGIRILVSLFLDALILIFIVRYLSLLYDAGSEPIKEPAVNSKDQEFIS